jgi:tRNA-guanine family transglycosylase
LRHLYLAGEILAATLHTLHNLYFYNHLMKKLREAIREEGDELRILNSEWTKEEMSP